MSLSLSLFFWQVASTFILSPVLVGMRGLQEARVRFLAARACFYKWTSILSFFFSFFLSLPASGNVYKDETNAVTSLLETVAPVLWLFCYEQGNEWYILSEWHEKKELCLLNVLGMFYALSNPRKMSR